MVIDVIQMSHLLQRCESMITKFLKSAKKLYELLKNLSNNLQSLSNELRELKSLLKTDSIGAVAGDIRAIKQGVYQYGNSIHIHTWIAKEAAILMAQDAVILSSPRYANPKSLLPSQAQMYSQNGEDGIIAEIFRRIGTTNRYFVEIGTETGVECNTRLLLEAGWSGTWIEGNTACQPEIEEHFSEWLKPGKLQVINAFVTRENINQILKDAKIPIDLDLFSLDIDINTHHVFDALTEIKPRVICVEYNSSIPPSVDFGVPYDPDGQWDDTNYFGAGLKTFEQISERLGYNLVGCDYLGINAFFVRKDLCGDRFLSPFTAEFHYEPPRYGLLNHRGHKRYKQRN